MEKFIIANNYGKGFITHEDQEFDGLKFKGFGSDIIRIEGEENKVTAWMNRVSGSEIEKTEAMIIVETKKKADNLEKIKELKAELVILENDVQ